MSAYIHQEYPKWVYPAGREPFIVQSRDEEEAALGIQTAQSPVLPEYPGPENALMRTPVRRPRLVRPD